MLSFESYSRPQYKTFIERKNIFNSKKWKSGFFLENFWLIFENYSEFYWKWRYDGRTMVLTSLHAQYRIFIVKKYFQLEKMKIWLFLENFIWLILEFFNEFYWNWRDEAITMVLTSLDAQCMTSIEKNTFKSKKMKIWLFLENFWLIFEIFSEF